MLKLSSTREDAKAGRFGRFSLRRSAENHPMGMFSCLVAGTFVFMAMVPASSTILGRSAHIQGEPVRIDDLRTTGKGDRLPMAAPDACLGQAWGAESAVCVNEISKASGRDRLRTVRIIAQAQDPGIAPNIF